MPINAQEGCMNNFELLPFANQKSKIPQKMLITPLTSSRNSWYFLTTAFCVDLLLASFFSTFLAIMFNSSMLTFLSGNLLKLHHSSQLIFEISFRIVPLIIFFQFLTLFLLNDGQSLGLMMLKKRLRVQSKSFSEMVGLALGATFACLSLGVTLKWQKSFISEVMAHDYLYNELIDVQINLNQLIHDPSKEEAEYVENFQKAA
jgi:hypothetical protein